MSRLLLLLFLVCLLATPLWATEVELRPLQVSNQAPLAMHAGLPTLDRARLLQENEYEVGLRWDLSSNYTLGNNVDEQLVFDGETSRVALRIECGLAAGWEAGLEIPVIAHRGGSLDGFIDGWHDFFGLPDGGREQAASDQLAYHYQRGSNVLLDVQNEQTGLGDVRLLLSRQLYQQTDAALAVHASLEVPTGDDEKLLGSGSFDLALWLSGEQLWQPAGQRFALHWGGGLLVADQGELLAEQRRPLAGTATLGLAWSYWPELVLQLQLDAHSSLFEGSNLRQVDEAAAQLAIGGALALGERGRVELAVVEDIAVDTAPDVGFHLLLSQRF